MKRLCKIIFALVLLSFSAVLWAKPVSQERQKLITYCMQFYNDTYVWGNHKPGSFDCSGFVGYCFQHFNDPDTSKAVRLPRTAHEMYKACVPIDKSLREPGDLVFFVYPDNPKKIAHIGIYLGVYNGHSEKFNGKNVFISAVSEGINPGIHLSLMDEGYWTKKENVYAVLYGRKLLPTDSYNRLYGKQS